MEATTSRGRASALSLRLAIRLASAGKQARGGASRGSGAPSMNGSGRGAWGPTIGKGATVDPRAGGLNRRDMLRRSDWGVTRRLVNRPTSA